MRAANKDLDEHVTYLHPRSSKNHSLSVIFILLLVPDRARTCTRRFQRGKPGVVTREQNVHIFRRDRNDRRLIPTVMQVCWGVHRRTFRVPKPSHVLGLARFIYMLAEDGVVVRVAWQKDGHVGTRMLQIRVLVSAPRSQWRLNFF